MYESSSFWCLGGGPLTGFKTCNKNNESACLDRTTSNCNIGRPGPTEPDGQAYGNKFDKPRATQMGSIAHNGRAKKEARLDHHKFVGIATIFTLMVIHRLKLRMRSTHRRMKNARQNTSGSPM